MQVLGRESAGSAALSGRVERSGSLGVLLPGCELGRMMGLCGEGSGCCAKECTFC